MYLLTSTCTNNKYHLVSADHEQANNNGESYDGPRMEGIEDLMAVSKFTREELQRMYRGFKNVSVWAQLFKVCLVLILG